MKMNINHKSSKRSNGLRKRITSLLLTAMLITSTLAPTITVNAANPGPKQLKDNFSTGANTKGATAVGTYNGEDGGSAEPGYLYYAGSVQRTGLLFYVVDNTTEEIVDDLTPLVFMKGTGSEPIDIYSEGTKFGTANIRRQLELNAENPQWSEGLPEPIKWNGSSWYGNGKAIGEWLLAEAEETNYKTELKNWENMILNSRVPGAEKLVDDLHSRGGQITLCIEPLSQNYIYYPKLRVEVENRKIVRTYKKVDTTTISRDTEGNETGRSTTSTGWTYTDRDTRVNIKKYPSDTGHYYAGASVYALNDRGATAGSAAIFGTASLMGTKGEHLEGKGDLTDIVDLDALLDADNNTFDYKNIFLPIEDQEFKDDNNSSSSTADDGTTIVVTSTYTQTLKYNNYEIQKIGESENGGQKKWVANYKWVNTILPNSMALDHTQLNLVSPTNLNGYKKFTDTRMGSKWGLGISMFSDELRKQEIDTCDGKSPHNTEDPVNEKSGDNYVVKKYIQVTTYQPSGRTEYKEVILTP